MREQNLRRLKDAIVQRLERVETDKKLVVVVQGLEAAIGTDGVGAYPPVLQDLNFIRDAYRRDVPHPLLFVLPDYAITRVSKYAPDFYAWCSGIFRFETSVREVPLNKVPFHPAFDYAQASVSALHVRYSISERIPKDGGATEGRYVEAIRVLRTKRVCAGAIPLSRAARNLC